MTSSTDQLSVPNENMNFYPSTSSLLPLPTPLSNRQPFTAIDNISSNITDNDLQRVPPSFMINPPTSIYSNTFFHFPSLFNLTYIMF